jgi:predicted transcriptional regulator
MRELSKLLFELSNEDRLRILLELKKSPMKLSRVSEKFDFTVPETARNMTRLTETDLIAKDADGNFHLTAFGEASLQLLENFEFISKNAKYFKTHEISKLPPEYAASIGCLKKSEFVGQFTEAMFNGENLIREAKEFVWICIDEILASSLPIFIEAIDRGIDLKKLMPRNAVIPAAILKLANDPAFDRAARAKKAESRYLDQIDFFLLMSEKEVSIGFKNSEGVFDHVGSFRSTDEAAIEWTKSLFLNYWEKAKRE